MVAGVRCDVKDGWTLDEPQLSTIDADTYVLSYRATIDGTCTVEGRTEKTPSPVRAATVWARSGQRWLAAFHGENPIFDPRTTAAPTAEPAAREAPNQDGEATPDARPGPPAADPRNVTSGKAETIRFWTEHQCDVRSVRGPHGTDTPISPSVGMLTFTGILEGTCGGRQFPLIYGASVYTKDGDAWKLAFTLNQLPNKVSERGSLGQVSRSTVMTSTSCRTGAASRGSAPRRG